MAWETINGVAGIINLAMLFALAAYTYIGDSDKVTVIRLREIDEEYAKKYEQHDDRLRLIESSIGKQPTHKDIAALYESINTLATTVNQLVGETRMQSDLLRMLISREVNMNKGDHR